MKLTERKSKVLFIMVINVVLLIPFCNSLVDYVSNSYIVSDANVSLLDTFNFKYVSGEIVPVAGTASRRIELISGNNHDFRIWNIYIDEIADKPDFFKKIRDLKSRVLVYSDLKTAQEYKHGSNAFITIEQVEINNKRYINLDKVTAWEKQRLLISLFFYPILAIVVTLYFRYKLLLKKP